ncbi:YdeI/OmpD-associated family protein [Arthrobacter sp. ISL-48]|uniref:YdeI/OmpD-associated family protein n=1 Tax=Arthrobacter sp. ISL-48 TaxID=2819110 RepID=UPI001BE4E702|nr:YdeI/OmpD-associated family protein [Arthrobacter sp. ISL-48]MBT2532651.1 YdeI/OmpD-associated family protein [Arthrobacter sp. ISL-48]
MEPLEFRHSAAWESWLDAHQDEQSEAWLLIGKRHSGAPLISIEDALDVALCHGWIDGQRKSHDDVSFLQRYSRRRARSSWSSVNVAKAEALIASGRMRVSGLVEIEAARADGRWEAAYESQRTAEVPPDLAAGLAADPLADAAFVRLGRSGRYAVILQLLKARTPEVRAKVLAREVSKLAGRD